MKAAGDVAELCVRAAVRQLFSLVLTFGAELCEEPKL